ncbi:glutathione S-transferase family protein [Pinirhizobacter soli]|uniref:glutathione S-transferase family protein n=1 Tax=Pinirhizobacter soli TaxID=2786953 RepID=UPI00202A2A8C|nr:glutathione S-transferase family protein [Pinirhizobacter soli]
MGYLNEGHWTRQAPAPGKSQGQFVREESRFRHWVTADGSPGPTGDGGFRAEPGRYHLYIARACPWAHRAMIFRTLKGLEDIIDYSVVHWLMGEDGWTFEPAPGVTGDKLHGTRFLYQLYQRADAAVTGRSTVPVLWDRERDTIVSNESADIIRMFNSAFDGVGAKLGDYYPGPLHEDIDAVNARVYDTLNNGVYKAGFATTQEAYELAIGPLFDTLHWLEERLADRPWLCGELQTEADWRLFTTLLRFDLVYHGHFKCNVRRLVDYPRLWEYTRAMYQQPGIAQTVDIEHIKKHYYMSHRQINPTGIVPVGPDMDLATPTDWGRPRVVVDFGQPA